MKILNAQHAGIKLRIFPILCLSLILLVSFTAEAQKKKDKDNEKTGEEGKLKSGTFSGLK